MICRSLKTEVAVFLFVTMLVAPAAAQRRPQGGDLPADLYSLDTNLNSRSISFENPTGAPGSGGKAASPLGVGRKGAPLRNIPAGESVTLCDIKGPGTIRHIWLTGRFGKDHALLRSTVVRAWWEGQEHPSIECPLGDFMGVSHTRVTPYQSAVHSVGRNAAFNFWLPMPFQKRAKITFDNESATSMTLYYQIDYTTGEKHSGDIGRLHTLFRRENPTSETVDFELLPRREGKGRFVGAVMGIRSLEKHWWGEGEVKFFMDGDKEFPTICGTGAEDYVGLSYGVQETPYWFHGCTLDHEGYINMYRWHLPDPIFWKKECRVTIQQIGHSGKLFEREDDWSTATFWYEPVPSAPLPEFPTLEQRMADLPKFSVAPKRADRPTSAPAVGARVTTATATSQ